MLLHPEAVARRCSVKKVFLKNFAKFTGKHLCQKTPVLSMFLALGLQLY